jgi:hypothetical protein
MKIPALDLDRIDVQVGNADVGYRTASGTARQKRRDNALATLRQGMAAGEFRAGDAELAAICFVCACIRSCDLRLMVESVQDQIFASPHLRKSLFAPFPYWPRQPTILAGTLRSAAH